MKKVIFCTCLAMLCGMTACSEEGGLVFIEVPKNDAPDTDKPGDKPGDPGDNPGDPGDNPGDPGGNPGDPGDNPGDPGKTCNDACSGNDECDGTNAFITCKDNDGDGCKEWVTIPCAENTKCEQGTCAPACADTCQGGPECDGDNAIKTCKDGDNNGCTEWVRTDCAQNQKCQNGVCVDKCTNACEAGKKQCNGNAVQTCGDYNNDGCLEWGADAGCAQNQVCSNGACANKCTNACENGKKQCNGKAVQTCGDYNGDGCFEWGGDTNCPYQCKDGACITDPNAWVPACSGDGCPIVVNDLTKRISGNTSNGVSRLNNYSCASDTNESGPEQSYIFKVNEPGTIIAGVTEPSGGDVDVHILSALNAASCLARGDKGASVHVNAGVYYVVADTYGGAGNAGAYNLKITFLPDSGKCGLKQTVINRYNSPSTLNLPVTGKVVQEAHMFTDWDWQQHGRWPNSFTEFLAQHKQHSAEWTGIDYGGDWCPADEGGCKYGQGSTGNPIPWKAEAWYICMYWKNKPAKGQRFLVVNPVTGEAVVAAAGYETGPGDGSKIGGAVYEIHKKLGTGHNSTLTFAEMIDQSLEYGPIQCE